MPKYYIYTYGCQMNYSDTERMRTYIEALGFKSATSPGKADLIIFNTCSVRQKAEDRVFGKLRDTRAIKKKKPNLIVVITGCMVRKSSSCYSETRDKLFNRTSDIDIALRIEELPRLASLIRELQPDSEIATTITNIPEIPEESIEDYFAISPAHSSKFQAFIPISTGCDKFCTYCIVPYSRGREKSRKIADVLAEAEELVNNGCKEITLVGQTVDSYGLSNHDRMAKTFTDVPEGEIPFVYLLKQLDKLHNKGLVRIRFTSPHPKDMSDDLITAIAELETLMPYLHLPVQAGHNDTLERMNRPYKIEKYLEIIEKLRNRIPGIAISTDVIVGFCGETEEEFQASYDLFEKVGFDHAYIAQYSNRPGTYASKNLDDDIPEETKHARWHKLNNILKRTADEHLQRFLGKTVNVLVEEWDGKICTGRSEHYKTVQFPSKEDLTGEIITVKIEKAGNWILEGKQV